MILRLRWMASALPAATLLMFGGAAQAQDDAWKASQRVGTDQVEKMAQGAEAQSQEQMQRAEEQLGKSRDAAERAVEARKKQARDAKSSAKREAEERVDRVPAGGRAVEQGSERANSQWQEGATRGQDRAAAVRDAVDEPAKGAAEALQGETGDVALGATEARAQGARSKAKGEPPAQAKGFWGKTRDFFGLGAAEEEAGAAATPE